MEYKPSYEILAPSLGAGTGGMKKRLLTHKKKRSTKISSLNHFAAGS
jgi:hypothetical protein